MWVKIEFSNKEKAQKFIEDMLRSNYPIRWDAFDDDAYDYVDVIDSGESKED